MKMTWKKKKANNKRPISNLSFEDENPTDDTMKLVESFQLQGNKLAEDGNFREALGKWESALLLMPDRAILHEQKAQILLELGETWNALKAATRATELEPSWAEAWISLGRAQLNYGEPDSAIESLDRALTIKGLMGFMQMPMTANFCRILVLKCSVEYCQIIMSYGPSLFDTRVFGLLFMHPNESRRVFQPDSAEAHHDRQAALHHIQRRKQLQTSGLSMNQNRFAVVDKSESA